MANGSEERAVFINCPFDASYADFLEAMVFTIVRCGFVPQCTLEIIDGAGTRIDKILKLIADCPFGIHDISRTELDPKYRLPRFNMPFELGLFLGARRFGPGQSRKRCLIVDTERYRYQKFLSDIAGQDIHAHDGKLDTLIRIVRNFLQSHAVKSRLPGGAAIMREYEGFLAEKPRICEKMELELSEIEFPDLTNIIAYYLQQRA